MLDKHIKLLDSPGVVFVSAENDAAAALRNAIKVRSGKRLGPSPGRGVGWTLGFLRISTEVPIQTQHESFVGIGGMAVSGVTVLKLGWLGGRLTVRYRVL